MKYVMTAAIGVVALMAGSAYAGGCSYGKMAAESAKAGEPVLAAAEQTDPKLVAKLKEVTETESLEKLLATPVIHN
ncbi:MAG: hypothetical protein AB8B63_10035 [Granulosicoccus sp.]